MNKIRLISEAIERQVSGSFPVDMDNLEWKYLRFSFIHIPPGEGHM